MSENDEDQSAAELPSSGEPSHYATSPELVIGLVGPLGTQLSELYRLLEQELGTFGYRTRRIRLSSILESISGLQAKLDDSSEYSRIKTRMKAGTEIRRTTEFGDILARLAISLIWDERRAAHREGTSPDTGCNENVEQADCTSVPADGTAYIIDSIKNPDEAKLLRKIYGSGFVLISAYSPRDHREHELRTRLSVNAIEDDERTPEELAAELIKRDESEEQAGDFGQRVTDAFPLADLVVHTGQHRDCENALRRFLQSFFNYPFHSPSRDEWGMYLAHVSSMRSLDMSRQVGAAIFDGEGSLLGQGHNDIPKHGGGLYWEGDSPDGRDYSLGTDYSVVSRRQIVEEIVTGLAKDGILDAQWSKDPQKLIDHLYSGEGKKLWSQFLVNNLLEFGRPLHAEMAAILDASRKGIGVSGSTLYCTTFPCHLCARMIIGAGVQKVVYMEPYPKSKTEFMYRDSVEVDPTAEVSGKVNFVPFVGVAPEKFEKIFTWSGKRRHRDGSPMEWSPKKHGPRLKRYVDTYIMIEARALRHAFEILESVDLEWQSASEDV